MRIIKEMINHHIEDKLYDQDVNINNINSFRLH